MSNLRLINETEITSTVSSVDVQNVFSADYDIYKITVAINESSSGNQEWIRLRLINSSGSIVTASEYDYALYVMNSNASFYETRNTNQSADSYSGIGYADDTGNGGAMYVFNPYNSSSYTFMIAQSGSSVGTVLYANKGISVHKSTEIITGINFHTIQSWGSGIIRTYGLRVDS